jgi:hypothetical protein
MENEVLVQRPDQAQVAILARPDQRMSEKRTFVFVSGSTSHMRDDMSGSDYAKKRERIKKNHVSRARRGLEGCVWQ